MMDMDMDMPADKYFAKVYWFFVGGVIGLATVVNVVEHLIYRQRLSAANKSGNDPARPTSLLARAYATITAVVREASNYAPHLVSTSWIPLRYHYLPPMGRMLLLSANLALLLSLIFYGWNVNNKSNWENMAVRAGWVSACQLPLVFVLAGKRNLVGWLTGSSYERLNWIHRGVARCLFITATIHFALFFKSWMRFNYVERHLEIDIISRRGLGAWCILLWILLSSFAPIRNWRYEFFVVQHIISLIAFTTMVMIHTPKEVHVYVWVPFAFLIFDRVVRLCWTMYNNLAIFHRRKSGAPTGKSELFACKATFSSLPDRATRITVKNPGFTWRPGQHVFLSCHALAPLQAHPFTITSLPSDGVAEFVVRAHEGGTKRLHSHASSLLPPATDACKTVFIDGPYGRMRPLEQFDSVVLFAGSTGASFVLPLLRDLVRLRSEGKRVVTRRIRLVWVVKGRGQVEWFCADLRKGLENIEKLDGVTVEASVYITCDYILSDAPKEKGIEGMDMISLASADEKAKDALVTEEEVPTSCGPNGTCCCRDTIDDEDAITENGPCCCCNPAEEPLQKQPSYNGSTSSSIDTKQSSTASDTQKSILPLTLPSQCRVLSGRPSVKSIINKELEKARGESAVVVCGPCGLVDSAREAVVSLSDERAVHKGTGAQGIYLHTEAFAW